jgi:ComF family protein
MQSIQNLLLVSFWQLLYPPRCGCCGNPVAAHFAARVCDSCLSQINVLRSPLCLKCGVGLSPDGGSEDRYCRSCLKRPPVFDSARSLFDYQGPVRDLLHRLKYTSHSGAASTLGSLIEKTTVPAESRLFEVIVPVPLNRSRLRKRGLNQALVLAKTIFSGEQEKIEPTMLIRVKNTIAQTRLSGRERRKNLRGAFAIKPGATAAGRRICLVDDIFTTGATVEECAKVLRGAGAARVDVLTLARVALPGTNS